jgi:hypothetical protein
MVPTPLPSPFARAHSYIVAHFRTEKDYTQMEQRIRKIEAPSDIGRILRHFKHKISNLTAQQIMTFVNVYSIVVWRDFLHDVEWALWLRLVRCSRLLSQHANTLEDRNEIHKLLIDFGTLFEREYGIRACVPNQHMVTHLALYMELYGPPHTHWCFNWERHNGHLGRTPTNGHSYPLTIMKRMSQRDRLRLAPYLPRIYYLEPLDSTQSSLFTQLTCTTMRSSDRGARESGQVVHDTTRLWCSDSDTYITGAEPFRGGLIKPKARLLSTDSEGRE